MKIDYEKVKKMLPIERVLEEYGLMNDLKRNKYKLYGKCPIHKGDNETAFQVDLKKNLWYCFTHCGGGSVIDLLMKIENKDVYQAGLLGQKIIGINGEKLVSTKKDVDKKNKPLEFRLKLNSNHPYIKQRKITKETANFFEIGFCSKGIMSNRIAIPIHDNLNDLVAYCGRAVNGSNPKYKFPSGFSKNEVLYNLNRVKNSSNKRLVIVEGFFDVFRLYQAGIDSVAVMGSSLSQAQNKQLESLDKELIFMFDGDSAGKQGMRKALGLLNHKLIVKSIYLPRNLQPDNLTEGQLQKIVL